MYHPKACMKMIHEKRNERRRRYFTNWIDIRSRNNEYCRVFEHKDKEDQFADIINSRWSNHPNMKSTIRVTTKVVKEWNQTSEKSNTTKGRHRTYTRKIRRIFKGKWNSKIKHLECIINIDIKLISEEVTFLWLSSKNLKADTGREPTVKLQALNPVSCNRNIENRNR